MQKQYCRVGSVTPVTGSNQSVTTLEFRYQHFLKKAADATYRNTNLGEFFSRKAEELKKILESIR